MFNPQQLSKDSPLALVWLAGNMDRKMTKHSYMRTDIVAAVDEIREDQTGSGTSLRVSGQLLFGVSNVYQHHAKYLKDDCDSALQSLRTFQPGNVDAPNTTNNTAKESTLVLQNQITDLNISNLMPDFPGLEFGDDAMFAMTQLAASQHPDNDMSIVEDDSIELGRGGMKEGDEDVAGDDDDLGLDFAADEDEDENNADKSVEMGLDRPPARDDADDLGLLLEGNDSILPKEIGDDLDDDDNNNNNNDNDKDALEMPDLDQMDVNAGNDDDFGMEMDIDMPERESTPQLAEEEPAARTKPVKRTAPVRRNQVTAFDSSSTLPADQTRQSQQEFEQVDRLAPLPANNSTFALHQLRNQPDVAEVFYLPGIRLPREIADLFAPDTARRIMSSSVEQDNDAGVKHARTDNELVNGEHEIDDAYNQGMDIDMDFNQQDDEQDAAGMVSDGERNNSDNEEQGEVNVPEFVPREEPVMFANNEDEDESAANPSNTGISRNTLQAARILRDEMPSESDTTSFNVVSSTANRPDKVKMFFEMLVLATKDAINVDQQAAFEDITVKSKEGLYSEVLSF